ncbi:MAG: sel1 repeat family protein, partial [Alphaproteobacteria bacterium]
MIKPNRRCGGWLAAVAACVLGAQARPAWPDDLLEGVRLYEQGDYAGAIAVWQPLAEQNDPNALFNMGQVYRLGRGVETDIAKAKDYYERAAVQGHVAAQGYLGTLLYFGDASLRDVDKAIEWWRTAAANGDAGSQYMLGVLYFNGDHVARDWVQAYAWMFLAVNNGLREARDAEASMLKHLSPAQIAEAKALA